MRPPFVDAALFAGHGRPIPLLRLTRGPDMSDHRFALLPRLDAVTKPVAFPSLTALAARLERDRQGQALELVEVEDLEFQGSDRLHRGVQVWTLDLSNARDRMLGYAWLDGGGREPLELALRAARRARAA